MLMATQGGEPEGNQTEKDEATCLRLHQEEGAGFRLSNQELTTYLHVTLGKSFNF